MKIALTFCFLKVKWIFTKSCDVEPAVGTRKTLNNQKTINLLINDKRLVKSGLITALFSLKNQI